MLFHDVSRKVEGLHKSLRLSHTQSIDVDEGSDQNVYLLDTPVSMTLRICSYACVPAHMYLHDISIEILFCVNGNIVFYPRLAQHGLLDVVA